ncbi:MAG TPA: hypothetical protein VLA54_13045, partial [Acidimicrobiia bacterium]|nr:hypothetical protein [Acidimicrobiia bacterium]
ARSGFVTAGGTLVEVGKGTMVEAGTSPAPAADVTGPEPLQAATSSSAASIGGGQDRDGQSAFRTWSTLPMRPGSGLLIKTAS